MYVNSLGIGVRILSLLLPFHFIKMSMENEMLWLQQALYYNQHLLVMTPCSRETECLVNLGRDNGSIEQAAWIGNVDIFPVDTFHV